MTCELGDIKERALKTRGGVMFNPMQLGEKHITITGASSGIGRAACVQASKLGARVTLVARSEERLKETLSLMEGNGHLYYIYDLNDVDGINALVKSIVENGGPLDGLVHCAGIGVLRPIKFNTPILMREMMQIHYLAFAELMRAAAAKNRSNKNASYIGVSSIASIRGDKAQGAYAAAKGAMNAIVHPYAKELAPKGIRVNAIAFGMVDTEMYRRDFLEPGGDNDAMLKEQYLGVIPPEYAGNMICFLLSDVSKYITGGTLVCDGGFLS